MIELESASVDVQTADGQVTILHPTTLQLAEHRVSIIGGNGSGKSTLARLCNGLITPTRGTVRVRAGHAAANAEPETPWFDTIRQGAKVRQLVGFMFTDPNAQLVMPTAIEDVALSLRRLHPQKPARIAAARAVLERFNLDPLADRSVHSLSGGQRQLLALATVLATNPAILVADEPTTLLDLRNGLLIRDELMNLPQQTIIVTHDLELAAAADRTLVVDGARIVFDGKPDEAVSFYRDLVSAPPGSPA